jgi:hypothetical protein
MLTTLYLSEGKLPEKPAFVQLASLALKAFAQDDQNIATPSEQTCSGI